MTKVIVKTDEIVQSEHHSDELDGDWSKESSFEVTEVQILAEDEKSYYDSFDINDIKVGDEVHVLSIIYATGDSFGRSYGNGEVVMVYKDRAIAETAFSIYDEKQGEFSIKLPFETEDGIVLQEISNPASGYFESLDDLCLETFIVQGALSLNRYH